MTPVGCAQAHWVNPLAWGICDIESITLKNVSIRRLHLGFASKGVTCLVPWRQNPCTDSSSFGTSYRTYRTSAGTWTLLAPIYITVSNTSPYLRRCDWMPRELIPGS